MKFIVYLIDKLPSIWLIEGYIGGYNDLVMHSYRGTIKSPYNAFLAVLGDINVFYKICW